ncbi:lytic transglycosylase [Shewanella sp. 10N.286.52.C2]|uniref:LysM peptidoglycan-binding domain-containing protein n=1 Tax=Shewanella sp. 10N.286.52.C2 TaxID=1880838 RepID=UPI000C83FE0E|nr:LysM peptidoglycan-binding domain-containing protein [Shewanella sp. 10N.286.52.C2]PMG26489.1 lytic transglycosylase [Shewanella sp. 10N.286.52.C2]
MHKPLYLFVGSLAFLTACQTATPTKVEPSPIVVPQPIKPEKVVDEVAAPVEITDVWQRIRLQLTMPIDDVKLVNKYRDWYLANPRHLEIVSQRAEPYLHYIVEELEKRNLPIELALLPIVESSFDPSAYSASAASGLWQLTTPISNYFGVKSDWWYDGRRDVPASTTAALDFLEYLYDRTGQNWLYAIAAYNTGEGRVNNAVRRNKAAGKSTEFWALSLPRETQRYVPQLIALSDVVKNADKYGIKLTPISNEPHIAVVDTQSQIDLKLAADLANMPVKELKALNPGLDRWATSPDGPNTLVVPFDKAAQFEQKLANLDPKSKLNWHRYQIKSGDTVSHIAKHFDTSASFIRSSNGLKNNNIRAGKYLIIPVPAEGANLTTEQLLAQAKPSSVKTKTYTVKSGDSLWVIARKNDVSVDDLIRWNRLPKNGTLSIGKQLKIGAVSSSKNNAERTVNYKVRSGDSLARIASKFNVSVNDLIEWNRLQNSKYIQPGQMLRLIVDVTKVNA